MAETTYPIAMWKDTDFAPDVRYAHTPKERESLAEAGFTDDYRALRNTSWPRLMYDKRGEHVRVNNDEEMQMAAEQGYSTKFVAKKEVTPKTAAEAKADNGRIDRLEEEIDGMKETLSAILDEIKKKK